MNFLDTYGIVGTGTSPPATERQPEQSLDEEVTQVIGQLGRFWGGFRKQSEAALATARRDFGQVVTQAQRELGKLANADASLAAGSSTTEGETSPASDHEDESDAGKSAETPTTETERSESAEHGASTDTSTPALATSTTQSLFSRLQSSLPPNVVSAVQAQLPDSLKNPQNIDLSHLRTTLSSEFQRVQGVTRAQAEEYVHKSEAMLREAMKEAGEVLREAVKVIPPEADSAGTSGFVWDGSNVWMLPGLAADADGGRSSGSSSKGKGKESDSGPSSRRQLEDSRRAVATRAESLLKQLRSNAEIIKLDPAIDTSNEAYLAWAEASEASGEGFGTQVWSERVAEALSDPLDGTALQSTLDTLVPSHMPEEVFWVRYFFRVHQIEAEETRRKALLQGTTENEDDFSWEDDEDESATTSGAKDAAARSLASSQRTLAPPRRTSVADVQSLPSSHAQSPAVSRRESEDSYDVVSGNVSNAGDAQGLVEQTQAQAQEVENGKDSEDSEDSDWE
ncbi:hypothetical protein PAXRUDRAFT_825264 [Paxillus rubicundulus Ve08.2h10]|uniref:BSD domain-containing protein n=1 Tax=Paxillus rubicundulus Ve08.2h10 TaxID=930991 RepID=A0A0D0E6J8_9AGAM|nr:hypothetical protein PAXRUDRAFT_825264 [Paxillus rubicundulus Ve08.2h10]